MITLRDLVTITKRLEMHISALESLIQAQGRQIDELNAAKALEKETTNGTKRPYRRRNTGENPAS